MSCLCTDMHGIPCPDPLLEGNDMFCRNCYVYRWGGPNPKPGPAAPFQNDAVNTGALRQARIKAADEAAANACEAARRGALQADRNEKADIKRAQRSKDKKDTSKHFN